MNPEMTESHFLAEAYEAQKTQIQDLTTQVTAIREELGQILGLLSQNNPNITPEPSAEPIILDPIISDPLAPTNNPVTQSASYSLNGGLIQEASKKVYKFPEVYKLMGPENYNQWKQALSIQLAAMEYDIFITDPSVADSLSKPSQALLLLLIRDSVTPIPAASIAWLDSPKKAYFTLDR